MKKIKSFSDFHVNEIISKDTRRKEGYDSISEAGLSELLQFMIAQISESPIAFELDNYRNDAFTVTGPFGITLYFGLHKVETGYNQYNKVGYKVSCGGWELTNPTAKGLIKEMKKSLEYKYLIKGKKEEKLRDDRLKKILQRPYTDENLIEYLYYVEPVRIDTIKSDNSGPWATSGTSIHKYIFSLSAPINAWKEHFNKGTTQLSDDEPYETMERIKTAFCKKRGFNSGGISSNSVEAFDVQMPTVSITVKNHTYYN